jgi:hypothetical protein
LLPAAGIEMKYRISFGFWIWTVCDTVFIDHRRERLRGIGRGGRRKPKCRWRAFFCRSQSSREISHFVVNLDFGAMSGDHVEQARAQRREDAEV